MVEILFWYSIQLQRNNIFNRKELITEILLNFFSFLLYNKYIRNIYNIHSYITYYSTSLLTIATKTGLIKYLYLVTTFSLCE